MISTWSKAKLVEVAPSTPLKVKDVEPEDKVWQLNLNQIQSNTGKLLQEEIRPYSDAGTSTHWFDESHVLYSKLRPYLNKVLLPQQRGLATTELVPMLPNAQLLNREYLAYYLKSKQFVDWVSAQTAGAKMPRVTMKVFWEHEISLPPLVEQQRIAAILDAADLLRQKNQQLIERYTALGQSLFLEMFGDPVTNSMGWSTLPLGGMLEFLTSGSRGWAKYYSNTGDLFLRIQNVGKNRLMLNDVAYVCAPDSAEAVRTAVKTGDILLSITADLGRTAVIPEDLGTAYINQHLALIRLKECYCPHYVSEYIASVGGKYQLNIVDKGGVKAGLNFSDIKSLKIPNPPRELQTQYFERCLLIDAQKQQAQASLEKSETLFNSLLQRAFKGELSA